MVDLGQRLTGRAMTLRTVGPPTSRGGFPARRLVRGIFLQDCLYGREASAAARAAAEAFIDCGGRLRAPRAVYRAAHVRVAENIARANNH